MLRSWNCLHGFPALQLECMYMICHCLLNRQSMEESFCGKPPAGSNVEYEECTEQACEGAPHVRSLKLIDRFFNHISFWRQSFQSWNAFTKSLAWPVDMDCKFGEWSTFSALSLESRPFGNCASDVQWSTPGTLVSSFRGFHSTTFCYFLQQRLKWFSWQGVLVYFAE